MSVANDQTTFLQIVRYRGDGPVSIPLTDPDTGAVFDPAGNLLLFTLKALETDADAAALVQKFSSVGGITVANPSVVTLVPADFAGLEPEVTYEFDIQAQSAATGIIRTVARGTLRFAYDITREAELSIPTTTTNPDAGFTWAGLPDKPSTFPPAGHAASHAAGGMDPVAPAAIGAETPAGAQAKADAAQAAAIASAAGTLTAAVAGLTGATAVANNAGDTTLTLAAGQKLLAAVVTLGGAAGTRRFVLADTNAVAGAAVLLNLVFPATAGIVVEIRNAAVGGTLLATVTSDGTSGVVGIICTRGAAAWNEPTSAAWLD